MAVFGFSLNNLSMFGLVLAIGIVVDDAIVVVENVDRWIEHGLSPRDAAYRAMEEVTPAVIAIACGLTAVFVPVAFISGITGQFYKQFALTISFSTLLSAFNSLTLSPALAALLLKPHTAKGDWVTRIIDGLLGWLFRSPVWTRACRLCGSIGSDLFGIQNGPAWFHSGTGSRLLDRCLTVARRLDHRSHRCGFEPDGGNRAEKARHRRDVCCYRAQSVDWDESDERGRNFFAAERLL